jgi:flagellar assembly protein FliH
MIIPKENVAGFQRWKANSFDQPAKPQTPESDAATPPAVGSPPATEEQEETVVEMPFPTADELSRINEEARTEGYRAGYDEGRAEGEAEMARQTTERIDQLSTLVGNLHVSLAHLDQEIGDQLLDLALEVAAQVLRGSLSVDRERLMSTIREALTELPFHHGNISLHLNPDDADALREILKDQLAHTNSHIVSDSTISAGGCYIKAGNSEIDATIETRWRRVLETIGVKAGEWTKQA